MALNSFSSNQGTQTPILTDNTGGINGTVIAVQKVDISAQGTAGSLWNGNVGVTGGTLNAVTISTLPAGTVTVTTGTLLSSGTTTGVGVVTALTNGSVNILSGTIQSSGTTTGVGVVTALTNGSVNILSGTLQSSGSTTGIGTVSNIGSLGVLNAGTLTAIPNIPGGTLALVTTVTNLTNGTIQSAGTVTGVGTMTNLGTVGTILGIGGTVNVTGASAGTFVNVSTGSMQTLGTLGTIQNILAGTIGTILGIGGTVSVSGASAGTFVNISTGTAQTLGTVGTIQNILAGTIGTILGIGGTVQVSGASAGTFVNISTGTLGSVTAVGSATVYGLNLVSFGGGTSYNPVISYGPGDTDGNDNTMLVAARTQNWNGGSWHRWMGSAGTAFVSAASGTINSDTIVAGTINTGTFVMTSGTLSPIPTISQPVFGTLGTTGASVFGTLVGGTGSGAGTEIFVTSLSLSVPSTAGSQQVTIGWGSNGGTFHAGTGRLAGGNFPPGGGIQKNFDPPVNSGTNAQLMYFQGGAGTVNIDISYFITTSTL